MERHSLIALMFVVLGCNQSTDPQATAPAATATAAAAAPAAQTTAEAVVTAAAALPTAEPAPAPAPAPAVTGYPLDKIKTIPDNCQSPSVILSTAPKKVGSDYPWNISRQALLANQQFKVVSEPPAVPGEVKLATFAMGESLALVAQCNDGGTCNALAAMYKAIVRTSVPQVYCGAVPGLSSGPVHGFSWADEPGANLPAKTDTVALCARLNACMIATDRNTPGDPFVECQRGPSKFKTACARRYPCAEVMACVEK